MDVDIEHLDKFLYSFSNYAPKNYGKIIFATISVIVVVICAYSAIKKWKTEEKIEIPKKKHKSV